MKMRWILYNGRSAQWSDYEKPKRSKPKLYQKKNNGDRLVVFNRNHPLQFFKIRRNYHIREMK